MFFLSFLYLFFLWKKPEFLALSFGGITTLYFLTTAETPLLLSASEETGNKVDRTKPGLVG